MFVTSRTGSLVLVRSRLLLFIRHCGFLILLACLAMQDHSLESIALRFKNSNQTITDGNPYENSADHASHEAEHPFTKLSPNALSAPPLAVLLHPKHVVICSFLGEESLESLRWLILPLRSPYAVSHPPITILDTAEPSDILMRTLFAFKNVVCVLSPFTCTDSY